MAERQRRPDPPGRPKRTCRAVRPDPRAGAYEKLGTAVAGDAEVLRRSLFEREVAEALLVETADGEAVGYAIFFTNFSTFECRPGIWLEDVYVGPSTAAAASAWR